MGVCEQIWFCNHDPFDNLESKLFSYFLHRFSKALLPGCLYSCPDLYHFKVQFQDCVKLSKTSSHLSFQYMISTTMSVHLITQHRKLYLGRFCFLKTKPPGFMKLKISLVLPSTWKRGHSTVAAKCAESPMCSLKSASGYMAMTNSQLSYTVGHFCQ